jgi:hypothetical protein
MPETEETMHLFSLVVHKAVVWIVPHLTQHKQARNPNSDPNQSLGRGTFHTSPNDLPCRRKGRRAKGAAPEKQSCTFETCEARVDWCMAFLVPGS